MATREQMESALRNAHAAGDTEAARKIANALKAQQTQEPKSRVELAREAGRRAVGADAEGLDALKGKVVAAAIGVGGGAFETVNAALRAKIKKEQGVSDAEAKELADAALGAAAQARPGAFAVGFGAGALGSGAGIVKGAQVAGKAVPAVGRALQAITPVAGRPVANAGKLAVTGGAGAGVAAANRGEDAQGIATEAAVGAVASPLIAAAARPIGSAANFARSLADKNSKEGFRILAKEMRKRGSQITPDVLEQRAAALREGGRSPTILDLVGEEGAETVLNTTFRGKDASRAIVNAAAKRATGLQTELAESIGGGRNTPSITKLERLRNVAADRAKDKIKDKTVDFSPDDVKALTESAEVRAALPSEEKEILFALEDAGGRLTIEQVDNIRLALRKKTKGPGGPAARLRNFANALVDDAGRQVPEYRRFLKSFARRSKAIEGAELGRKALTDSPSEFADKVAGLTPAGRAGARLGGRLTLRDTALESPKAAANLARSLAEDAGPAQNLAALDPAEAARLRRLGAAETESLRGVAKAGAVAARNLARDEQSVAAKAAIDTLLSGTGAGSLSFKVSAFRRFFQANRVPPTASKKLAEALVDPARTDETLALLRQLGVDLREVEKIARATGRAGGRVVAQAGEDE